jgi:hypothetical protein
MFLHGFHIVSSGLRQQPPDETWGLALPGRGNRWLFSTKAVVGVGPTSLQGRRLKPTPVDDIHTCIYIFIYLHIYLFIHTVYMYRKLQNKQHIGNKEMLFFFGGIGQAKPCILWDVTGIYISFGCVWNRLWCTPVYHMKNRKHVAFFSFFSTHTHTGSQTFELMQTLLDLWKHMYGSGLF